MTQFANPNIVKDGTPDHRAPPVVGGRAGTFNFGLSTLFDGTPAHRARQVPGGCVIFKIALICVICGLFGWVGELSTFNFQRLTSLWHPPSSAGNGLGLGVAPSTLSTPSTPGGRVAGSTRSTPLCVLDSRR